MRNRSLTSIAVVGALAFTLAACGDDGNDDAADTTEVADDSGDMADEPGTIVDVAVAADDFNTLVAAVQAAGLVEALSGEDELTVFAPTDEAFAAALEALGLTADELLADTDTLTEILTYHVVAGEVMAADVVGLDGQSVETLNGASVEISVDGETVMVNEATVVTADVDASNGVIHIIDAVLLPPAGDDMADDEMSEEGMSEDEMADDEMAEDEMAEDEMAEESMEGDTIVDVAVAADDFNTLVAAVEAAGLVEALSGEDELTVFAPTDEAFEAALEALGLTAEELLADTETLTSILTYHVVAGEVLAADVVELDGESVETLNGATIDITVDGDTVMVNDATVVTVDVDASNGVIHVIDTVLVPPAG